MKQVTRLTPTHVNRDDNEIGMVETDQGEYVRFEDYERLQALIDKANAQQIWMNNEFYGNPPSGYRNWSHWMISSQKSNACIVSGDGELAQNIREWGGKSISTNQYSPVVVDSPIRGNTVSGTTTLRVDGLFEATCKASSSPVSVQVAAMPDNVTVDQVVHSKYAHGENNFVEFMIVSKSLEYDTGWAAYYAGVPLNKTISKEWTDGWMAAYDNEFSHRE